MSLIKCPECGKEISDQASSCPNCGYGLNTTQYGHELGTGIKEGLKGLNTAASPKRRKICILLISIPLVIFFLSLTIGVALNSNAIMSIGVFAGLCLGIYQFYVGKFSKGIIYTITMGGLVFGAVFDLLKLFLTKSFKDANGFPLIY